MLTLFAIPRAFNGHIGLIQRNAIASWTRLSPRPQIVLFGDDAGTAELAAELGLEHLPALERSEFGTPLMSDMFAKAQRAAAHDLLCFVNADIILTRSLLRAVEILRSRQRRFFLFCTPWNVRIEEPLDFSEGWEQKLRSLAESHGEPPCPVGVDAVVFPRDAYQDMPAFAVARTCQDNWLIHRACRGTAPAVDATPYVFSIHQDHEGTTHWRPVGRNEQYERNHRLAGNWPSSYVAADLPYVLERDGALRKKTLRERLRPRIAAVYNHPLTMSWLQRSYNLRRRIGLYRGNRSQERA